MKKITVEVWSDFVCPWCWIAKKRLEKAIQTLGDEVEVDIVPRAYRLAKGMTPIPFRQALEQKTGSQGRANALMEAVRESASREGLDYQFNIMRFGDTSTAHQYVKAIADPAIQARYVERLYLAGTTEGMDIFNETVLRELATEVGATHRSDFDSAEAAIASDEAIANGLGSGVPLFVIDGTRYISGAQETGVFIKALRIQLAENEISGTSCSLSGCSH